MDCAATNPNPGLASNQCPDDAEIVGFFNTGITFTAVEPVRHPFNKLDYSENTLILTRLPTDTSHGPSTELVVYASIKRTILDTPGFPTPLPTSLKSPAYVIKKTEEDPACIVPMGRGLYATRDLNVGDLILAERPLIVVPERIDLSLLPRYRPEWDAGSPDSMFEQVLRFASARDEEKKKAYMELANCHQDSEFTMVGIRDTNSFRIPEFKHNVSTRTVNYSCVMNDMSRINHSCAPNTTRSFDVASLSYLVYASRFIGEGKQIFLSYHGSADSTTAARKLLLRPYNINCRCLICSLPDGQREVCDRFRVSLPTTIGDLENNVVQTLVDTSIYRSDSLSMLIDEANVLIRKMEQYGMEASTFYARALTNLAALYVTMQASDPSVSKKRADTFEKCQILRRIHKLS